MTCYHLYHRTQGGGSTRCPSCNGTERRPRIEGADHLRCEKCGESDISTSYRAPGDTLDFGIGTAPSYFERVEEECLRRYCRTCEYRWTDPVAGRTDWTKLRAMSEEEIERRAQADEDNPPLSDDELAGAEVRVTAEWPDPAEQVVS